MRAQFPKGCYYSERASVCQREKRESRKTETRKARPNGRGGRGSGNPREGGTVPKWSAEHSTSAASRRVAVRRPSEAIIRHSSLLPTASRPKWTDGYSQSCSRRASSINSGLVQTQTRSGLGHSSGMRGPRLNRRENISHVSSLSHMHGESIGCSTSQWIRQAGHVRRAWHITFAMFGTDLSSIISWCSSTCSI